MGDKELYNYCMSKYGIYLNKRRHEIYSVSNKDRYFDIVSDLYSYAKSSYKEIKKANKEREIYDYLLFDILEVESLRGRNNLIEELPKSLGTKNINLKKDTYNCHEEILDSIVAYVRYRIADNHKSLDSLMYNNLKDKCYVASRLVSYICRKLKVESKRVKITPAYAPMPSIYNDGGYHFFSIVTLDDKSYIVDTTYHQFFTWYQNNISRLGTYNLCGCAPGVYMLLNEKRKEVAKTILQDGWILLTEENLKNYLDGFTLSYRNGLYYENLGESIYETDYTYDDYQNFLFGDDNQIKHEGEDYLGYQKKALSNPNFKF